MESAYDWKELVKVGPNMTKATLIAQLSQHCTSLQTTAKVESSLLNAMEETATTKVQTINLKLTFKYLRSKYK